MRKRGAVLRVPARERQREVEAQTQVREVRLFGGRALERLAAPHDLEDQLLVFAAALSRKHRQILDGRSRDGLEAERAVDARDRLHGASSRRDLVGQKVSKSRRRGRGEGHGG